MLKKIDQFVFITDTHIANKQPVGRVDNYNDAIFKKIEWVLEYCKEHNVDKLIHGGDLFHSYKIADELAVRFVDLISKYKVKVYYIIGNHDVQGANTNFIDKTNLGLLTRYPWFNVLNDKTYEFKHSILSGKDYTVQGECETYYSFPYTKIKKHKILAVHTMIVNEPTMRISGRIRQVNKHTVETDADLMLCGHYHNGFKKVIKGECLTRPYKIINPGSIARIDSHQAIEGFGPRLVHIKVFKDKLKAKLVSIPCIPAKRIFDLKGIKDKKQDIVHKDHFAEALKNISTLDLFEKNFQHSINTIFKNPPDNIAPYLNEQVVEICNNKIEEYMNG